MSYAGTITSISDLLSSRTVGNAASLGTCVASISRKSIIRIAGLSHALDPKRGGNIEPSEPINEPRIYARQKSAGALAVRNRAGISSGTGVLVRSSAHGI